MFFNTMDESILPFLWLGKLAVIIQLGLCFHVYKTGRPYWWIWVLLMAPIVGGLLYFFIELLPQVRYSGRHHLNYSRFVPKSIVIRRLEEELNETDTIENRLALALMFHDIGRKDEAEKLATPAVSGVFRDDPEVIADVCWFKIEAGKYQEASELLSKAAATSDKIVQARLELIRARIKLGLGQISEALNIFNSLHNNGMGEEPRYRTGECFFALGEKDKAKSIFEDIIKKYRKGNVSWRRAEKTWFNAAKLKMKELR